MRGELDRRWVEVARHFDALAGEIERAVEQLALLGGTEDEIAHLQRVKLIAGKGACLARTKSKDESD